MSQETKTILIAVDFQEASQKAIEVAKELAGPLGASLVLVHVCSTPVYAYPGLAPLMMEGFSEEITGAAQKALDELARSSGGLESILRQGDAGIELLAVIQEKKPFLVVMGTHGRRGITHLLLGSVAEKIVRQSPVPVLTVHADKAD